MSTAVVEEKKTETKLNQLEQLKKFTKVVADTADFESIKEFKPQDATTNPSLVYAATQKQQYAHLIDEVLADRKKSGLSGHGADRRHLRSSTGPVRLRHFGNCARTRFDRDRRAIVVRRRRFDQESAAADQALRRAQNSARTRVDQNCVNLGRIQCGRATAKGRDPLQSDAAVFAAAGGARGGSESAADLAVRRADLRLVQEGEQARLHRARKIPECSR